MDVPSVLDADAVTAFAGEPERLRGGAAPRVLTPHPGEVARLLGWSVGEAQSDRLKTAREAAARTGCTVVLKGARTIIADPRGDAVINPTGNAGMASGGTGDVLTGMVAALLGQGMAPLLAAIVGVYLHGLAGDVVAQRKGEAGLVAGDLVEAIPEAWMQVAAGDASESENARLRRLI
jgi:NAD(P)H-hydrate epimerase